ncbi:hypothetical protein TPA0910_11380 [Streptomyces hygroscopicus subsp. sporocinereus]|uniref:IPT/TIG domain-containing protein n=1 Tax=Streptomyces hygroscopicus TaxID=1912 RepID=A0ABQ3TTQ2_STRHY|nr:IPT/TIG domain-containing protein [Streptomyces hygroscopicus]GHJ26705.1 hypothetical protein TPA0910_11380 [Streptomyces hygroscopicus]
MTLFGTNFLTGTQVGVGSVGNVAVTPTQPSQVTFTAPANPGQVGTVSTQPVTITTAGGTSASGSTLIDYYLAPAITSVVPATGTAGDQITINGTGFVNVDTVTFTDSAAATATAVFTPISASQLVATGAGGLATGAGTITLHTCGGNSNAQDFTITWPPGTGHPQHEPSSRRPRIGGTGGDVPPPSAAAAPSAARARCRTSAGSNGQSVPPPAGCAPSGPPTGRPCTHVPHQERPPDQGPGSGERVPPRGIKGSGPVPVHQRSV